MYIRKGHADLVVLMNIFICRHGETHWSSIKRLQGKTENSLNSMGITTSNNLAVFFKYKNLTKASIVSSPLKRAAQTAEIIARKLKTSVVYDSRLSERDFGELTGFLFEEVRDKVLSQRICGFENDNQLRDRIKNFWNDLVQDSSLENKTIVIVTHSLVINMLLSLINYKYDLDDSKMNHKRVYNVRTAKGTVVSVNSVLLDE